MSDLSLDFVIDMSQRALATSSDGLVIIFGLDLKSWAIFDGRDGTELERGNGDGWHDRADIWERALGLEGEPQ